VPPVVSAPGRYPCPQDRLAGSFSAPVRRFPSQENSKTQTQPAQNCAPTSCPFSVLIEDQYRQLLESNDSIPAERYDRLRVGVAQITRELYAKFLRLIAADERIKGACAGNATILRQALKTFDNRLNAELTRVIDAELDKYYSDRSGQS